MICITGIGVVSPYGIGKDLFLSCALKGSGINQIETLQGINKGGFIKEFPAKNFIPIMKLRKMSKYSQLAIVSAIEAWKDSAIQGCYPPSNIGVVVGTGLGSVSSTDSFYEGLLEKGPEETNPMLFPETVQNIASAHISIEFGIKGPNTTISQASVAGEHAVFYACELLKDGMADAFLVTGADELTEPLFNGMNALRIFSKSSTIRPFDIRRDGLLPGEGACTVVLERFNEAKKRDIHIYGVIDSFGFSTEPVERLHYSSSESMKNAIKNTVSDRTPELIIASANSTLELDYKEALAIKETLGSYVPITAMTSITGYFMSSGIMKVAAAMLFMKNGIVPPIWGLEKPEVEGLNYIITPQELRIKNILLNSFSHGGSNACIFLRDMNEA